MTIKPEFVIGIDPGLKGAIATLTMAGNIAEIVDMPTIGNRVHPLHLPARWPAVAGIEEIQTRRCEYPQRLLTSGINGGIVQGFYSDYDVRIIRPQDWGLTAGIPPGTRRSERKKLSRELAAARWPDHADMFRRVKDDGRADACWIAEHRRQLQLKETFPR